MTSVALAHDVLGARAGGERVLLALASIFPEAPIHSLLHQSDATFAELSDRPIHTSWLQRSSWLRENYRAAVPVAAPTFAATKIDAAVTICSTSGLSHHVRTTGAKVVYCHTPARWLHDSGTYLAGYSGPVRAAARFVSPAFRRFDQRAMQSADRVLTNSNHVASEINEVYAVEATVVPPCSSLSLDGPIEPLPGVAPGFVLSPVRPLAYKRLDVLAAAARQLPAQSFVHLGEGPHRRDLLALAPRNLTSFGAVSDAQLRWAYRNASVTALTCAEDFGLVPLEAAAHGVHTVAPAQRGLLDHDTAHMTLYPHGSADELTRAISQAPEPTGTRNAAPLGVERFTSAIRAVVDQVT